MFIWLGIDVDDQLQGVKKKAMEIEQGIGFEKSNFTLPYHISLKISFEVNEMTFDDVVKDISEIYTKVQPFDVFVKGIELENSISWIMMHKNYHLDILHDSLNKILLEKYGVPLHEYDTDYKFHTTLFMDENADKVVAAYGLIRGEILPERLIANKFVIGVSSTGEFGTYRVIKEILK